MSDDFEAGDRPPSRPDDEAVARLLRLAGRPPRLPDPEVAPIRAAARAAWRGHLGAAAARRRRWATAAAAIAATGMLAAVGLVYRGATPRSNTPVAALEVRLGEVEIDGVAAASSAGDLSAGTVVRTGKRGGAALRLAGGSSLRIDGGSEVRLDTPGRVTLAAGALYVDARHGAGKAAPIEVATPLGAVREVGTQFEVRLLPATTARSALGPALRVRVREGAVLVLAATEQLAARAGSELTVLGDGRARRAAAPAHGATWEWVQRTAPPLAIDGATLATFLEWTARETGLEWRLAGAPPGAAPGEIVLHGSIAGLTPEEALAVVLPGAGFRHRRVGGELWLEPRVE